MFGVLLVVAVFAGLPAAGAQPRTVNVAVHELEPMVMKADDGRRTGFAVDVWQGIADRNQWTTNYIEVEDAAAELDAVAQQKADVAIGGISITAERTPKFDFTQPTINGGLQIMVPMKSIGPAQLGILPFLKLLFSKTILIWLLAGLAISLVPALIMWLLERRQEDSMVSRKFFPGIFQALGWGFGGLGGAGDGAPTHWMSRILAILWGFVAIVFVAYYTATLTTNMTVAKIGGSVASPSDLVGKRVGTVEDSTSAEFLQEMGVQPQTSPDIEGVFQAFRDGQLDAVVFDSPVLQYYVANDGASVGALSGPVFQPEDYGFAFRPGDPMRRDADNALLSMRADGTVDQLRRKWFGDPEE